MPQIEPKHLGEVPFVEAAKWIIAGYFFKLFVANNLNDNYESTWISVLSRRVEVQQIVGYCFSCIAIKSMRTFSDIQLSQSAWALFRIPSANQLQLSYISKSFSEFWTRWHISSIRLARVLLVFFCVSMAWIFFKLPNFAHALAYMSGMLSHNPTPSPAKLFYSLAVVYSLPVLIQHLLPLDWFASFRKRAEPYIYGAMAAMMYLEAGPNTSFIYFQF